MRRQARRGTKAFTLIELLLVAGILAVLAAFAIPKLFVQATQVKTDLAKAAVGRNGPIGKALQAYQWDMGKYPETDEGLAALFVPKEEQSDERYKGPYLETTGGYEGFKDPWNNPYEYRSPGDVNEDGYDLWSWGPDQTDDEGKAGSDDIKNWVEK